MAERLDLDRLEQLLETMNPAEIRARFGPQLAAQPECRTFLGHFEAMDAHLARLKYAQEPPVLKLPERGALLESGAPTALEGDPTAPVEALSVVRPRRLPTAKTGSGSFWVLPLAAALLLGLFMGSEIWFKESSSVRQELFPLKRDAPEAGEPASADRNAADLDETPIESLQPASGEPDSLGEKALTPPRERRQNPVRDGLAAEETPSSAAEGEGAAGDPSPVREASKLAVTPRQDFPQLDAAKRKKAFAAKMPPVPQTNSQENQKGFPTTGEPSRGSDFGAGGSTRSGVSPPPKEETPEPGQIEDRDLNAGSSAVLETEESSEPDTAFLSDSRVQGVSPYDREIIDTSTRMTNTAMTPADLAADWADKFQTAWRDRNRSVTAALFSDAAQIRWPLMADQPLEKAAFLDLWSEFSATYPAAVFRMTPAEAGGGFLLRWRLEDTRSKSGYGNRGSGTARIELDGLGRCRSFTAL